MRSTRARNFHSKADQTTQNCRRGSSKGHWVCTCTIDNLWKGSDLKRSGGTTSAHSSQASCGCAAAAAWRRRRNCRCGGSGTGQGGDEAAAQAGEMSWRSTGARGRSSDVVEGEARPAASLEPTASRWSMRRRSWQCVRGSAGADGIDGAGGVQRFGRDATCRRFFFGEFYMCSI
jgi:hypothetical protein